jgi:hypothetical protein
MRGAALLAMIALALGLSASSVLAAVQIQPDSAEINQQQQFTITVANDGELAVESVEVTAPGTVKLDSAGDPPPQWSLQLIQEGKQITGAIYRGGEIDAGQSVELTLLATPKELGTADWSVQEILENGGSRLSTGPALSVEVVEPPPPPTSSTAAAAPTGDGDDTNDAAVWLGAIAIILAIGALVAAGLLWTRRPMGLPPDGS